MKYSSVSIPASLTVSILALLTALWSMGRVAGQEILQHRLDLASTLLMAEIGAVAEAREESEDLTLGTVFPKGVRPQANRGVDVRQGDQVVMLNGQRVRTIQALRLLYEGLAEGDEVKMALKRGGLPFLVSFAKAGENSGGSGVRLIRAGGQGDVELFHESMVLLGEQAGEVRVVNQLHGDGDLHEGDIVEKLNGQAIESLGDFRRVYGAIEVGELVAFDLRRGEGELEIEVAKAERPGAMVIR